MPDLIKIIKHLSSFYMRIQRMADGHDEAKSYNLETFRCLRPQKIRQRGLMYISLYSSKIIDKKDVLRTVSNTSIYYSSNKVGTVYLV
jgi:hypothetical protein